MSSSSRRRYVLLGAAGALLGLASGTRAANWEILPRLEGGGTYNDNYRMAEGAAPKLRVYGPYADVQLDLNLISPRGNFEIVPHVHTTYFPSDTADDSTDEYLTMDGEYHGLRSDLKGAAEYSDEAIITSELLPATFPGVALGQEVGGEYGRVSIRNRRQLERVAPEYTYDFTQRAHLDLQALYDRASFSNGNQSASYGLSVTQIGFENYGGRGGMRFDVTPESTVSVSGVVARFQPQRGGHDTNRYGVDVEWGEQPSQIMHTYLRVGANRVQANTVIGTASTTGFSGGAGVAWRYQITEVILDLLRNYSPSSAGAEVVNDELRFRVLHAFKPRLSGFFAARAVRLRGASSQPQLAIDGEDYFTGEAGVDYQFTMRFRVQATYDYTWQRFQGEPSAGSNAFALAFIYQPLSRYQPLPEFTGIPQEPAVL